jgi:hypothetical protein
MTSCKPIDILAQSLGKNAWYLETRLTKKNQFGDPTRILGSGDAPAPAEIAYWYVVTGKHFSVAFYFVDGTCGEIRIIRSSHSEPFTMQDLRVHFEEYTGVQSDGCSWADEPDLKSIVSTEQKCLARTVDPTTLYIEDFRYFAYEVQQHTWRNRIPVAIPSNPRVIPAF